MSSRPRHLRRPWNTARRRKAAPRRAAWLARTTGPFRPLHRRRLAPRRGGDASTAAIRRPASVLAEHRARPSEADIDAAVPRRARRSPAGRQLGGHGRARVPLRHRPRLVQQHARLLRGAGDPRQRQADPRDPRHRHPAGRAPFLPPRRLGAADGRRAPRPRAARRRRPDHPVELPAADAGLEDRAGACRRQHGGAEARRVHPADRAAVRRDLPTRPGCRRAWSTSSPATAPTGALHRRPSRRRQDRLHRLDRGRPHHPQGHRRLGQDADARARRQVALHRLRRRRSRQRRRGRGRCDLVQPGPGLLRRLAAAGAGRHRRRASSRSSSARMETLRVGDPLDKCIDIGAIVDAGAARSASTRWSRRASPRARDLFQPDCGAADRGLLLSADAVHRRVSRPRPSCRRRSSARCWSR